MSPNKTAIWVAACVGCFCLAAFALHLSLPAPNIAGVTPKLQFVASNVDEIDALFIPGPAASITQLRSSDI